MGRIVIFLFCLTFLNPSMAALDEEAAESLVHDFFSTTRSIVNSGKSESEIWNDFNSLVEEYCDIPWIAASVAGPIFRRMSQAQKVEFARAYKNRLVDRLIYYSSGYFEDEIKILEVRRSGHIYVVFSKIYSSFGESKEVEWHISDRKAKSAPRIINLSYQHALLSYVERVTMERILENHNGDIDGFIEEVKLKTSGEL